MNNIYQSIANIMQESIAIGKEKLNKQQGFKYRGIDDVMNTFYPLLSKHKVFVVPEVLAQEREERTTKSGGNLIYSILRIKYTFYAEDGTSVSAIVIGEGMDSADKASNKAMAVAMKYAMFQVFCIPTEEMPDPDEETPPPSTKKVTAKSAPVADENKSVENIPDGEIDYAHALNMGFKNKAGQTVYLKELDIVDLARLVKTENPEWEKLRKGANVILEFKSQEQENYENAQG